MRSIVNDCVVYKSEKTGALIIPENKKAALKSSLSIGSDKISILNQDDFPPAYQSRTADYPW